MARTQTRTLVLYALAGIAGAAALSALSKRPPVTAAPGQPSTGLSALALNAALSAGIGAIVGALANGLKLRQLSPNPTILSRALGITINAGLGALTTFLVNETRAFLGPQPNDDRETLIEMDSGALLQAPPDRSQIH